MDISYTDHLTQLAERHLIAKLRKSQFRLMLGYGSAAVFVFWCIFAFNRLGCAPAMGLFGSGYILAGGTPKIFRQIHSMSVAPINASPSHQNEVMAIRKGIDEGTLDSPKVRSLGRQLKIITIVRLLGLVALIALIPLSQLLSL